jgi:hypothetical protein
MVFFFGRSIVGVDVVKIRPKTWSMNGGSMNRGSMNGGVDEWGVNEWGDFEIQ